MQACMSFSTYTKGPKNDDTFKNSFYFDLICSLIFLISSSSFKLKNETKPALYDIFWASLDSS